MVGLHCCGDLTPAILKLFANQVHPSLSVLVVVGCCYHKMSRKGPHSERGIMGEVSVYMWRAWLATYYVRETVAASNE